MKRITADIDSKSKLKLFFYIWKAINNIEKIKSIEIKRSHSKGYHIFVWTTKRYTKKEVYRLRKIIGDDQNRIKLDKLKKGFGEQTLWNKKIHYV